MFLRDLFAKEKIEARRYRRLARPQAGPDRDNARRRPADLSRPPRTGEGPARGRDSAGHRHDDLARNVEITLEAAGLGDAFELIIAKEDVARVKPAPDGYLLALDRLGLKADVAIALEDSPTGIASAKAAGVRVVAVGHRRPDGAWTDGLFIPNLIELSAMLKRLGVG